MRWYPTKQTKWVLDKYCNLRKLSSRTLEAIRKNTAKEIFVKDKEGNAYCSSCMATVILPKSKHLGEIQCPSCKKNMKAIHVWRREHEWSVRHIVVPQVLNENELVLRYVYIGRCWKNNMLSENVMEVARLGIDFKADTMYPVEYKGVVYSGSKNPYWKIGTHEWFREHFMYNYRKDCVLQADPHTNYFKEIKKLDCSKYIDVKDMYSDRAYVHSQIIAMYYHHNIIEKLQKVGMSNLAKEFLYGYSYNMPKIDENEPSIVKALGLTKSAFNRLKTAPTKSALLYLQKRMEPTDREWNDAKELRFETASIDFIYNMKLNYESTMNYLKKIINGKKFSDVAYDYKDYVNTLDKLGYKRDKQYLFPKDFEKADERVNAEYREMLDREEAKRKEKQSTIIKKISDGLRNLPDLQELLGGSNGLLVRVPETAEELLAEGRAQHNCVGTYIDRIANGKTLVFFVRQIDAPDKPFVTFEYCNGEVIQCRYDYNKSVDDEKIISFVDAFAEKLRKNNILYFEKKANRKVG